MNYEELIEKLTESKEAVNTAILTIIELRREVGNLKVKNRLLKEARENANEACAKWEGLYRAELEKKGE